MMRRRLLITNQINLQVHLSPPLLFHICRITNFDPQVKAENVTKRMLRPEMTWLEKALVEAEAEEAAVEAGVGAEVEVRRGNLTR